MMVIPTLHFCGQCEDAISLYKKAFGCKVHSLLYYGDAVQRGWEQDIPEKRSYIYHAEVYFGNQLFRMSDGAGTDNNTNTSVFFAITLDTVEDVEVAFAVLQTNGSIIDELESTPYSACMGSVMDSYGIRWRVMTE